MLIAGEDVVCAYMDDTCAATSKIGYCVSVDAKGCCLVLFGFIYIGVGGTINYEVHAVLTHKPAHCRFIGDVERMDGNGTIRRNNNIAEQVRVLRMLSRKDAHLVAKLAVSSGDKNRHNV